MSQIKTESLHQKKPSAFPLRRRIWAALGLAAGITGLAYFMQLHAGSFASRSLARINHPLPSLMVEASGVATDLNKFIQGTRCVIVFYSPSCRVCREVLPFLSPVPAGLRLILINESPDLEEPQMAQFPGAAHFRDSHRFLVRSFTAISLPIILLVDEHGILRDGLAGPHRKDFVQQKLKDFAVNLIPSQPANSDTAP